MLSRLVSGSLAHPRLILLATLVFLVVGAGTLTRARYDVFPEFVPAQATVQTEAPGLVAEQVEVLVTRPLEDVINGANGVAAVRSESIHGLSVINVTFADGADPYRARQIVAEQLALAVGRLPAGVAQPTLTPLTSSTMDLLKIGFVSDRLSAVELRDLVEWTIRTRMLAVPGVARANIFGGSPRRLEVHVRPADLLARGLTLGDVINAVRAATAVRGGGFIDTPAQRILVETRAPLMTADVLADGVVAPGNGLPVRLRDVAEVTDAPAPPFGDALIMGRPGVLLTLSSQYGANTLDVTRRVEAALDDLKPAIAAASVRVYPALHRPANFIETALDNIMIDLAVGAVLIVCILLAFLRDLRSAVIAFVSIPLSLLAAIMVMHAAGMTINTMTLGGLAVALGVVIDDAVVGIENIVRRLRLAGGEAPAAATILSASIEVRAPVVYATIVLAVTVAPILFLSGLQGAFFAPLALAFLLATLASLFAALTVMPALALLLLSHKTLHQEPRLLLWIKDRHERWLCKLCPRTRLAVGLTVATGVVTVVSLFAFGGELLPAFRERHYVLQLSGPPGASLNWMRGIGQAVTRDLLGIPGVATVEQQIGRAAAGEDTWPPNRSEFHVELERVSGTEEDEVLQGIRDVLAAYPGVQTEALTFLGDRIGESLSGETAPVAIGIYGADLDILDDVAGQVATAVGKVPDAADVQVRSPPASPLLRITPDPVQLGLRGLAPADAYDAVEATFQGLVVGQVTDGQRIADVAVAVAPPDYGDPESAGNLLVSGALGAASLGAVAELQMAEGRASILHDGGRRRQVVTVVPARRDLAGFVRDTRAAIERSVRLPPGVYLEFAGAAAGEAAAKRELLLNVAVAAIVIVAVLILAFGDGRAAALILSGAPFALAGGVAAIALTGGVLSLGALVGFVTLFGIAARNTILLIAHADHLVSQEHEPWNLATVLRATRERVTPILMTAAVTGLGLVPLAWGNGEAGREVQGPMAVVILGGLISSTAMSLLLAPPLIMAFRRSRRAAGLQPEAHVT